MLTSHAAASSTCARRPLSSGTGGGVRAAAARDGGLCLIHPEREKEKKRMRGGTSTGAHGSEREGEILEELVFPMRYDKGTGIGKSGFNSGITRGTDSETMEAIKKANAAKQYYWIIQSSNEQLHEDVCNMLRNEIEPSEPDMEPGAGITWNHAQQ